MVEDSVLPARRGHEAAYIIEMDDALATRTALISWQLEMPVEADRLQTALRGQVGPPIRCSKQNQEGEPGIPQSPICDA